MSDKQNLLFYSIVLFIIRWKLKEQEGHLISWTKEATCVRRLFKYITQNITLLYYFILLLLYPKKPFLEDACWSLWMEEWFERKHPLEKRMRGIKDEEDGNIHSENEIAWDEEGHMVRGISIGRRLESVGFEWYGRKMLGWSERNSNIG